MRNMHLYRKRLERNRMKRKAKRLAALRMYKRMRMKSYKPTKVPNWMMELITQLIRREKGHQHVDKDKEQRHQDR